MGKAILLTPMSKTWNNGFCGCCSVKGCSVVPCCIPNMCCPCMPMMWASATSQIKGKEEWGSYLKCCPVCTFAMAYMELAPHYGIKEQFIALKSCFPVLSFFQLIDTIMVQERLHMPMAGVAPDGPEGGPPAGMDMQR